MVAHTHSLSVRNALTGAEDLHLTVITLHDGRTMTDLKPEPCIHPGLFCTGRVDALYRCYHCNEDVVGWDL